MTWKQIRDRIGRSLDGDVTVSTPLGKQGLTAVLNCTWDIHESVSVEITENSTVGEAVSAIMKAQEESAKLSASQQVATGLL